MSENQISDIASSDYEYKTKYMKRIMKALKEVTNEMSSNAKGSIITPTKLFENLVCKFQQLQKSDADARDRYRQGIVLCNELIDSIATATIGDADAYRICLELFSKVIEEFRFGIITNDEKLLEREIFFAFLDLLSKREICTYLNDDQCTTMPQKEFYKFLTNVLLAISNSNIKCVCLTTDDAATRKYTDTFYTMWKRVERNVHFTNQTEQKLPVIDSTTNYIRHFFWNFSNRTVVVPWLLDNGVVKIILECLKTIPLSSEKGIDITSIILNISRHDDGVDELNKFDGLRILKDIQSNNTEELDDSKNLIISMAIAHLSTVEQIRSDNKRKNRILNELLQVTINAAKMEDRLKYRGFHVSEPLAVFTKLFVDDLSLEYVLNHAETDPQLTLSDTIALFINLFIEFCGAFAVEDPLKQFTCTALLNILWSISFQDRYKAKLKQNNKDLLETIKSLAMDNDEKIVDRYVPRSMEGMRNAANGILYNLNVISDNKKDAKSDIPIVSNTDNGKPMIMISYAHDNDQFCDKILMELEKSQDLFGIWIDRNHCSSSEDLWEKIARGIGQAKLVVCLLSQDYFNSKSCRKEASFAIKRKKPIVPIYFGEPGDCDWLDIHIADRKYIRFKSNKSELDDAKVQEMLRTIEATIKEAQEQSSHPQQIEQHSVPAQPRKEIEEIQSTTIDVKKTPEEWTRNDIQKWFYSHNVPDTLLKLFDFQSFAEMNQYASKLQANPKNEFLKYGQRYAKAHAGDELEEYIFDRFKNALLELPVNRSDTMKLSTPSSKPSSSNSSTCTIS
ncbi:unnamed protein product [Adineta steineri]|uniref:TIR domain-containing protein n=1 Tax=Adineta steineri TaxID=433720 RepID=A0A815TFQ3_9BILA|nr:unnamed protein product [Adineta steineri]CAF1644586.1 unnamed protein product [Adineta steineri]